MSQRVLCCRPNCHMAAHPFDHPLNGFCCGRCVLLVYGQVSFNHYNLGQLWYSPGNKHYCHCTKEDLYSDLTSKRAETPPLTKDSLDKIIAFCDWKNWGSKKKAKIERCDDSITAAESYSISAVSSLALNWKDASHARLMQNPANRPALVYPLRHVTYISKMPVVIIVLTYEGSLVEEWDGFQTLEAEGIRRVKFFGRPAKIAPQCQLKSAVSDGILPILDYMCNDQFDSDTRFIFMEEDWRPYNLENVKDPMDSRTCIEYIVHLAMQAADKDLGEFVWATWEQHCKNNESEMWPTYGNNCQVYTVPFAKALRAYTKMHDPTDMHWDVYILKYLMKNWRSGNRTCFCRPSIGGYSSHKSGCSQQLKNKDRKCDWTAYWRSQLTKNFATSEVELRAFKGGTVVKHSFDPTKDWSHRLRTRNSVEQDAFGITNVKLPVPKDDPNTCKLFAGPPPRHWSKRAKRVYRQKRLHEKLRNDKGIADQDPGALIGPVTTAINSFDPLPMKKTFSGGCIQFGTASNLTQNAHVQSTLPRKVWMYWEQGIENAPTVIKKCVEKATQILKPTWDVIFLDENTIRNVLLPWDLNFLIEIVQRCNVPKKQQLKADLLRLMVLSTNGGVWCDCSTVFTEDLRWLLNIFNDSERSVEIFAFTMPFQDHVLVKECEVPLLEVWFIACVKGCQMIKEWCKQYKDALLHLVAEGSLKPYIKRLMNMPANTKDGRFTCHKIPADMQEYLFVSISHQIIMQTNNIPIANWRMAWLPSADGPYKLHHSFNWNSKKLAAAILLLHPYNSVLDTPRYLIKLRGGERDELEKNKQKGNQLMWLATCRFKLNANTIRGCSYERRGTLLHSDVHSCFEIPPS